MLFAAFTLLGAATAWGEVMVRTSAGTVDVTAQAAPLSDVLSALSDQTGMKVLYEGPRPQARVSVHLEKVGQAEAVLRVLEGVGAAYALAFDRSGERVETLFMVASTGPGPAPAPVRAETPPPSGPPDESAAAPGVDQASLDERMRQRAAFKERVAQRAPAPAPSAGSGSDGPTVRERMAARQARVQERQGGSNPRPQ